LSAVACVLVVSTTHSGSADGVIANGQTSKEVSKEPGGVTSAIDELRSLIGELQAEVEGLRSQTQKAEESLRRARAILSDLERRASVPVAPLDPRSTERGFNPNDPMQDEMLSKQALAERTPWSWPAETATPELCAGQFGGGYDVEIAAPKDPSSPPMIQVRKEGKDVAGWRAHSGSVFVRGGDMLYYADFSPYSAGCSIVAYHLKQGERWKTPLWGLGAMGQSMYANHVNMKLDGNHLIVYSDESAGRTIQLVDVRTGRIVGRRGGAGQRLLR
jgi:hypothetical protein